MKVFEADFNGGMIEFRVKKSKGSEPPKTTTPPKITPTETPGPTEPWEVVGGEKLTGGIEIVNLGWSTATSNIFGDKGITPFCVAIIASLISGLLSFLYLRKR